MCSLGSTIRYCCVGPAPFDDIGDIPYHDSKEPASSSHRSPEVSHLPRIWAVKDSADAENRRVRGQSAEGRRGSKGAGRGGEASGSRASVSLLDSRLGKRPPTQHASNPVSVRRRSQRDRSADRKSHSLSNHRVNHPSTRPSAEGADRNTNSNNDNGSPAPAEQVLSQPHGQPRSPERLVDNLQCAEKRRSITTTDSSLEEGCCVHWHSVTPDSGLLCSTVGSYVCSTHPCQSPPFTSLSPPGTPRRAWEGGADPGM